MNIPHGSIKAGPVNVPPGASPFAYRFSDRINEDQLMKFLSDENIPLAYSPIFSRTLAAAAAATAGSSYSKHENLSQHLFATTNACAKQCLLGGDSSSFVILPTLAQRPRRLTQCLYTDIYSTSYTF